MMMFIEIYTLLLSLVLIMATAALIIVYYWDRKNEDSKVKIGFFKYIWGLPGKCGSWIKKTWIKLWDSLRQSITGSKNLDRVFLIVPNIFLLAVFISQRGFMYGLIGAAIAVVAIIVFELVIYAISGFLGSAIYDAMFEDTLSKDLLFPVAILVVGFGSDLTLLFLVVQFHPEYIEGFYTKLIFWGVSFPLVIFWLHRLLEMCQNTARYISSARRKIPAAIYLFCITCLVLTLYVFFHIPFGVYSNLSFNLSEKWAPTFFRTAYYVLMTVTTAGDDGVTPIGAWGKFDHAVLVLSGVFFLTVVASMFLETGEEEKQVQDAEEETKPADQSVTENKPQKADENQKQKQTGTADKKNGKRQQKKEKKKDKTAKQKKCCLGSWFHAHFNRRR